MPFDPNSYPDQTVGKVVFPDNNYCTGTLVGDYYMLTAGHCFYDRDNKVIPYKINGKFYAGYNHGYYRAVSGFLHVWYGENQDDWALVQLEKPLGRDLGFVAISSREFSNMTTAILNQFKMISYSSDRYKHMGGKDPSCSIEGFAIEDYLLITNCNGERGSSGAAILDQYNQVVGVFIAGIEKNSSGIIPKFPDNFDSDFPNFATPAGAIYSTWVAVPPEPTY